MAPHQRKGQTRPSTSEEVEVIEMDTPARGGKRKALLAVACVVIAVVFYSNYGDYLTFKALKENREEVLRFVEANPRLAPACYLAGFILVVSLSIPGATVLSFAGGLFFAQPWSTLYAWLGSVFGATLCFILVRTVFGEFIRRNISTKSSMFRRFKSGLDDNHILYMVFIRYVIVVPFWFVNAAAAILGVPLGVFFFTTLVATVPGSLLYTTAGSGLAAVFEEYDPETMPSSEILKYTLLNEDIKLCLLLLAMCLSVPIGIHLYSSRKKRRNEHQEESPKEPKCDNGKIKS